MKRELILIGSVAAPGIAIGPALICRPSAFNGDMSDRMAARLFSPHAEIEQLDLAIAATDAVLAQVEETLRADGKYEEAHIFIAHRMILHDPILRARTVELVENAGKSAAAAIVAAGEEQVEQLLALSDSHLRSRAADVRDLVTQVRRMLMGEQALGERLKQPSVIVAYDIGPSELMSMPRENLLGIALAAGGPTAHVTILARALGIPAVVGLGSAILETTFSDTLLALDGGSGQVVVTPSDVTLERMRAQADLEAARLEEFRDQRDLATVTRDGLAIKLLANVSSVAEARQSYEWGAAGIGLLRTEMLFLDRPMLPDEEEQLALYQAVVNEISGHPAVARTLDLGGDKYLPGSAPHEANPFLGWRAIRIGLSRPEAFMPQLRALLRAGAERDVRILLPMISTVQEIRQVRALIQQALAELAVERKAHTTAPQIGVMIEVPAAALMADSLAPEVDFFSIGTNDLVQYTLACDRTNQHVAHLYQPLEPAVLRLIMMVITAAHRSGRTVTVCGEMAGDAKLTALLIGMGVDELSCSPASLPLIRNAIRLTDAAAAQKTAQAAVAALSLEEVCNILSG